MDFQILFLGFSCLAATGIIYVFISHLFTRMGLSLVRTDPHTGFSGMMVEFAASVILSFVCSAALAYLFTGILILMGVPLLAP